MAGLALTVTANKSSTETAFGQRLLSRGMALGSSQPASYKLDDPQGVNEDSWLIQPVGPQSAVLAVADGVGGYAHGDRASRLAIDCLRKELHKPELDTENLREPILNAIERCNELLLNESTRSATTLVVVELQGDTMRPYHVGDSSILVTGQRGLLKMQSISHSPIGFGIEAGLLAEDAALHHDERHWVSNLIGSSEMRIEVGATLELAPRDTLLLCSDGLTDNVAPADVTEIIRKGPLADAMMRLTEQCQRQMATDTGHPDDLTLILYRRYTMPARRPVTINISD